MRWKSQKKKMKWQKRRLSKPHKFEFLNVQMMGCFLLLALVSGQASVEAVQSELKRVKSMVGELRVADSSGAANQDDKSQEVELLFEGKHCQRKGSWISFGKEKDPAKIAANAKCFKLIGNDCQFTFKAIKPSTAAALTFKPAPDECAIESFNLTFYYGSKKTATVPNFERRLDTSKASHHVRLPNQVMFDRLTIGAKNSPQRDAMCLCEIFVKDK